MEDEDDGGSFGGKGKLSKTPKKNKAAKPPQVIKMSIHDDNYPSDLAPGTKPEFEWTSVKDGVVREVMDQGNRRTCWSVASSRELSGRLVVAGRFDPPLCLSALHLLVGLIQKVDATGGLKELKDLRTFLINEGTILEGDCTCPKLALELKADKSKTDPVECTMEKKAKHVRRFKVKDLIIREGVDEREIMELLKTGPVTVGLDIYPEFTKFKGDGVFLDSIKGLKIDEHLLIVYGYGTLLAEGIHYWKVQNSAGKKWGKDGFGKIIRQISRGQGQPSVFTHIVSAKLLDDYEGQRV